VSGEDRTGTGGDSEPAAGGKADTAAEKEEATDAEVIGILERAGVPPLSTIEGAEEWFAETVQCIEGSSATCTFFVADDETYRTDNGQDAAALIAVFRDNYVPEEPGYEGSVFQVEALRCSRGFTGIAGRSHLCRSNFTPSQEAIDRDIIDVLEGAGVASIENFEGGRDYFVEFVECVSGFTRLSDRDDNCRFTVDGNAVDAASDADAERMIRALGASGLAGSAGYEGTVWTLDRLHCIRGFTGEAGRENVCRVGGS
jgi:hypothetical protein